MVRTGRRIGASGTRERIRSSAQEIFGELGFDGTSIRAIAARAEVDPALVHHYFGTKQRLFLSVMDLPIDPVSIRQALISPGPDGVGERLVRIFLTTWDEPSVRPILSGIFRSATTDPDAANLLRTFLGRQGIFQIMAELAPDRADLRAVLAGSQLIGLAIGRYIVGLEPLVSTNREELVAILGPTFERYLRGDL